MKQMIKLDQEKEAINKDIEIVKRRTGSTTEQVTVDSNNFSFGRK